MSSQPLKKSCAARFGSAATPFPSSRSPASPQNLPKLFSTTVPGRAQRATSDASGWGRSKLYREMRLSVSICAALSRTLSEGEPEVVAAE